MKGAHSLLNVQVPRIKQVAPQLLVPDPQSLVPDPPAIARSWDKTSSHSTGHRKSRILPNHKNLFTKILQRRSTFSKADKKFNVWCTLSTYNTNNYCIIVCAMNFRFHTQPALLFFAVRKNIVFQTEKFFRLKLKRTTIT